MRFCDVAIMPLPRIYPCLAGRSSAAPRSGVYFSEIDFARILNEAERWTYFSLRCLAFIFRLSCHHKVRWARLINSCGRGTQHVVGRLCACDVPLRHVLWLISNGFRNSNARPLYRDTVPLICKSKCVMNYDCSDSSNVHVLHRLHHCSSGYSIVVSTCTYM